jgi:hypothetical protein
MRSLPRVAQAYIIALTLGAGVLGAISIPFLSLTWSRLVALLFFSFLIALADIFPIRLPQDHVEVAVSTAVKVAAAILYGPAFTIWVTLLGTVASEIILRRVWFKAAFNTAQLTITFAAASFIYQVAAGQNAVPLVTWDGTLALLLLAAVYFAANSSLLALIISFAYGAPFFFAWRSNAGRFFLYEVAVISLGIAVAILWPYSAASVVLVILPLWMVRHVYQLMTDLESQTRKALVALADVIDARDPSTYHHSLGVAMYGEKIARQMGLGPDQVELIVSAARLHDLGKVGINDDMLYKPGKLSREERERFQLHSEIGAGVVGSFPLFTQGKDLVLYHQEHYDGGGYPRGLKGEEIPLGSRIIAVADAYEAMTASRPYRQAMTPQQAIAELKANSGTQFDPVVVEAMLSALAKEGISPGPAVQPSRQLEVGVALHRKPELQA